MANDDFTETSGLPFRRLSDLFVEQSGLWLEELGLATPPRAVSTMLPLADRRPLTVTEIAKELRFSHPFIIQLVRMLASSGLLKVSDDTGDRRRRLVKLTRKGAEEAEVLRRANEAMAKAYGGLFADAKTNGLQSIERIEAACQDRSLLERPRAVHSPNRKRSK